VVILKDKDRFGQPKKFEDAELLALLDENKTLEKLVEALNVGKSIVYTQWERFKKKANVS